MQSNDHELAYKVYLTPRADRDLLRLTDYLLTLDTQSARSIALEQTQDYLSKNWKQHPFFERHIGLRVYYVSNWYSVFYTVNEDLHEVLIIAVLAQAENLNRLQK